MTGTATSRERPDVRLIAVDVDGTLLTPEHAISAATRAAVHEAVECGAVIALASSRGPVGLRPILADLGLAEHWFIAYQGALVARWAPDGQLTVLTETRLDPDIARLIAARAHSASLSVGRYAGTRWAVPTIDPAVLREARITGEQPTKLSTDELAREAPPHKLLVIAADTSAMHRLEELARNLPAEVTATYSHANYLEITATGIDKGGGLTALARHLAIPIEQTAAIGDGDNDVAMFRAAAVAIAMGHAPERVKAAAGRITHSNRRDGLAHALRDLCLARATRAVAVGREEKMQ
jgi:Cof subfamily protein (haloacid dehalogenase superfamily)